LSTIVEESTARTILEPSTQILSEITIHNKYARYLRGEGRRESWDEVVDRNKNMHLKKYPEKSYAIEWVYENFVRPKKVLPSMRSAQFAGPAIEINNARIFNCAFHHVKSLRAFSTTMFLLLGGSGVGYSVQKHHVDQLPPLVGVERPTGQKRKRRFLVSDNIEGWADAVKVLIEAYFHGKREIDFDFRAIRPKGAELITSGGKAPGPEPLRKCLIQIQSILENALQERGEGTKLKPIEAHDILCHIADAVLAGGIRRAAMIALFSIDDNEMMTAKAAGFHELHPQRFRANNSVVLHRDEITKNDWDRLWSYITDNKTGEPGVFFTRDYEMGTNPCAEIALPHAGFCNLTEINANAIKDQKDLNDCAVAAAYLGTWQAGYTDFHYLDNEWRENAEADALLGVSQTGIANPHVLKLDHAEAARHAVQANEAMAKAIGINKAKRVTCVKPSGTTSLVLGTSSGIHAWHNDYYIRRMRVGKNEAMYQYLINNIPELVEDDKSKPDIEAVISVPQKAPEGAMLRSEPALETLERVKRFHEEWIQPGHREGVNTHNVSCTINIKDYEWERVGEWMWENRDHYAAIATFPYFDAGGHYAQTPFEDIEDLFTLELRDQKTNKMIYETRKRSQLGPEVPKIGDIFLHEGTEWEITDLTFRSKEDIYDEMYAYLKSIDLSKVTEAEDNTELQGELACAGDACAIV